MPHQAAPGAIPEEFVTVFRAERVVVVDLEDGREVIGVREAVGFVVVDPPADVGDLFRFLE